MEDRTFGWEECNSEGGVSLCHLACYKPVTDFYFTTISPPFCCCHSLFVGSSAPDPPQQCCSFLSHCSSKANGRKPNSSGNLNIAQQTDWQKAAKPKFCLNNKTGEKKPSRATQEQWIARQAPLERAQEAGSRKSNIHNTTQCQWFFPLCLWQVNRGWNRTKHGRF